jgi:hypothetical protein
MDSSSRKATKGKGVDGEVSRRIREDKVVQIRKDKRLDRANLQRRRVSLFSYSIILFLFEFGVFPEEFLSPTLVSRGGGRGRSEEAEEPDSSKAQLRKPS